MKDAREETAISAKRRRIPPPCSSRSVRDNYKFIFPVTFLLFVFCLYAVKLRFPYRRPRDASRAESQQSDICPQKSWRRRFKFGSRITPAVAAFLSISHFEPPIPQPYVTCQIGVIGFPRFRYCIIRGNVCRAACMYSRLTQRVREAARRRLLP